MFKELSYVIAYVPNHAIQAAFGPSKHLVDETEPSWTYQGTPLPCFPLKVDWVNWSNSKSVVLKDGFIVAISGKDVIDEAIIPVENINGPVLLISAGDDRMWPSNSMSHLIMARLKQKKFRYLEQSLHIHYPEAGHLIMTPWWPTTGQHAIHPVDGVDYDFGGTPQADAIAGYDSWQKIKTFLSTI
jgi:pimeloyl-ACP methyl ester carboxylesterase